MAREAVDAIARDDDVVEELDADDVAGGGELVRQLDTSDSLGEIAPDG